MDVNIPEPEHGHSNFESAPHGPDQTQSFSLVRKRLTGVDVARLIAIAGMIMVHFGPNPVPDTLSGQIYDFSHGRASILFALLAGVGVTMLFGRRTRDRLLRGRTQLVLRALILLPLGLWLQDLNHGVLVILQFYALFFVYCALIGGLDDRALLAISATALAFGPLVYDWIGQIRPEWFQAGAPTLGEPATKIIRDLLATGNYPLITWAAPITLGVWLARRDLRSTLVRWAMVTLGLFAAVSTSIIEQFGGAAEIGNFNSLLMAEPHSQTHLWMIDATGIAVAVLGLALLLSDLSGRLLWPLVIAGQMALSIYVIHLVILHESASLLRRDDVSGAFVSVGLFMLVAIAACSAWGAVFSRGPLEAALRAPWTLIEKASGGR